MELLFINNVIVNWLYIERRQKKTEHFILYYLDTIFSIYILYLIYI